MTALSKNICVVCLLLVLSNIAISQPFQYGMNKEKIYLHTNHVFFKPDNTLYFKLYLVNASDQRPSATSNIAYVEVISPSGSVKEKITCLVKDGYATGSYHFNNTHEGGVYTLRAYTRWMKNEKATLYFEKNITLLQYIAPRILMKLDFLQKGYGPGDQVLAVFKMRSLSDQPIGYHPIQASVQIDGKEDQKLSLKTDDKGVCSLSFRLPAHNDMSRGLLSIRVEYNSYTESISQSIPITMRNIDLQFMPESGVLLESIDNRVAFKALSKEGKAVDLQGEIIDQEQNIISHFKSEHMGMGYFNFTPLPGKIYYARIKSPASISQLYNIQAAKTNAIGFSVRKQLNNLELHLKGSATQTVQVQVSSRGNTFFTRRFNYTENNNSISIPLDSLPAGINQITILNSKNIPLAERLYFQRGKHRMQVSITSKQELYEPREKVTLNILTQNENGPVPANLSISVVDDKLYTMANDKQDHILSWLLMSSELKGEIEEPGYYFDEEKPNAESALDLVMLTHGYRYFDYSAEVLESNQLKYVPEKGRSIAGIVTDSSNNPVSTSILLSSTDLPNKALQTISDKKGYFEFQDLNPNILHVLYARKKTEKEPLKIKLLLNSDSLQNLKIGNYRLTNIATTTEIEESTVLPPQPPAMVEQSEMFLSSTNLNDVTVIAFGQNARKDLTGALSVVNVGYANTDIFNALEGRVAGIAINNDPAIPGSTSAVSIRGYRSLQSTNHPLIILDGSPLSNFPSDLSTYNIQNVQVINGSEASALYGSRAINGVIILNTYNYRSNKLNIRLGKNAGYTSLFVQGLQNNSYSRNFYAPVYKSTTTELRNDFRETIYWNGVVQTDKDGKAEISFYNSDANTTFRAIAEGIAYTGQAGRTEFTYASQSAISLDAKIPPYASEGDQLLVPVVITNNRSTVLQANLFADTLNKFLKIGPYDTILNIPAKQSKQILIPVSVKSAGSGTFRINIQNNATKQEETLILPIQAAYKYFPVTKTFMGNEPAIHQMDLTEAIPNTISSNLMVYSSLEGQLLKNIEDMLREPYGCFEQVSSTTYPNVFILNYLRSVKEPQRNIEEKALGYIKKGYKKLIAYQNPDGGFGWFSGQHSDLITSAYALLEFTDMSSVIQTDEKMIKRIRDYLLGTKDGEGNFKLAKIYYPVADYQTQAQNAYILYALSKTNKLEDFLKEYEWTLKSALETQDSYCLALMALTAHAVKRKEDYARIIELLNTQYESNKMQTKTTAVFSYGISKEIETMAFYGLAVSKEPAGMEPLLTSVISKLLKNKSYYGYGSTQGTVLALNLITEHAKLFTKNQTSMPVFQMNGYSITPFIDPVPFLQRGENELVVSYPEAGERVSYEWEVSYQQARPDNSTEAPLILQTSLKQAKVRVGETVPFNISVKNKSGNQAHAMSVAKIGIPAGLLFQSWQLQELMDRKEIAYYEVFDNYLVLYWMSVLPGEEKRIQLDLQAAIPGTYQARAGNCYVYYSAEHKYWAEGTRLEIMP